MSSYRQSLKAATLPPEVRAAAEIELRERARQRVVQYLPELERCANSAEHFINSYCKVYEAAKGVKAGTGRWIPFKLWKEQVEVLYELQDNQLVIILKARQLGMTWLVLAYALWLMLFHPSATILVFSLRETEAIYLVDERLKGMCKELPPWMLMRKIKEARIDGTIIWEWVPIGASIDSGKHWKLLNGSSARAFSTNAGDSYTATLALIDEADLVPDLDKLMGRVKPTIDNGGQLVLLSRVDKSQPQSEFKRIYKAAKKGELEDWVNIFLPWNVHPKRDEAWHARQEKESLKRTESLDYLWEPYPATDVQALAPRSLDKRIPSVWMQSVYEEESALSDKTLNALVKGDSVLSINNFKIYRLPKKDGKYLLGMDPAEGNPTSDNSSLTVMDWITGEQMAKLSGKFQPGVFALYGHQIGIFYNNASVMIERNNHGHSVLLWFDENNTELDVLEGPDEKKGWLDNQRGKTLLYNATTETVRTKDCLIHDFVTFDQLSSIEGSTLRAPKGEPDDDADSFALCCVARERHSPKAPRSTVVAPTLQAMLNYKNAIVPRIPTGGPYGDE